MAVKSRKIPFLPIEDSEYSRMKCSQCGTEKLHIDYGPLRRGGTRRQKGFFARCPKCKDAKGRPLTSRITAGHRV